MPSNWKALVRQLRNLSLVIRHQAEQAEAKVQQANSLLRELQRIRVIRETVVLGPVLFVRSYAPTPGGNDTGEVVQAALCMEDGVGAAFWDTELFSELSQIVNGLESEVSSAFVPFERCEPSVRAALLPYIEPLVGEVWRRTRAVRRPVGRQR